MREIERVRPFDVASADIVAQGEADDLELRRQDESQFRLRDRPLGVMSDSDRFARSGDSAGVGLEEEFGPVGAVDLVVE